MTARLVKIFFNLFLYTFSNIDFCQRDYDVDEEELSLGEVGYVDQCLVWAFATKSKPQDGVDEVAFPQGQLEWSKPGIHFDNSAMAMLALLQVIFFSK
jgi:hypothetical protein